VFINSRKKKTKISNINNILIKIKKKTKKFQINICILNKNTACKTLESLNRSYCSIFHLFSSKINSSISIINLNEQLFIYSTTVYCIYLFNYK
jgi:hypothetical protein